MNHKARWILAIALGLAIATVGTAFAGNGGALAGSVQAKKKYLKNTVVYLEKVPGKHAAKTVRMDQKGQKFAPTVLPVVVGSTVEFLNSDNTGHNVFSPDGEKYDLGTWNQGEIRNYMFKKEGVYTQLCKMHPSMLAFILVLQNPYFATIGADGKFEIKDVPPGDYTLKVWNQRKKGAPVKVTVTTGKTTEANLKLGK